MRLGPRDWIDPETLLVFRMIDAGITKTLDRYRAAIKGYQEAIVASEKGTSRVQVAMEAHRQAIAAAVAEGLSPEEVYARVGEFQAMGNAYARDIRDAYLLHAQHCEREVVAALASQGVNL